MVTTSCRSERLRFFYFESQTLDLSIYKLGRNENRDTQRIILEAERL